MYGREPNKVTECMYKDTLNVVMSYLTRLYVQVPSTPHPAKRNQLCADGVQSASGLGHQHLQLFVFTLVSSPPL